MIPKSDYLKQVKGKKIDVDGVPKNQPYQCVDLTKDYLDKCFDIKNFSFTLPKKNPHGYARSLYENFECYPQLQGKFIKIKNTAKFVPRAGDIVEWGEDDPCGVAGHTALALGKNTGTTRFRSLDQNWAKKYYVDEIEHGYKGVLGVIRPLLHYVLTGLNVRSGPGLEYTIIGVVDKGTMVKEYETKDGWTRIGDNRWVSSKYLD